MGDSVEKKVETKPETKPEKKTEKKPDKKANGSKLAIFFKGVKSEFKKITWPDKETLAKESAAVIVITIILGIVIALVDMAVNSGVDLIL